MDVMSEDWDNLIILDACRYDYLNQYYSTSDATVGGELRSVVSKGAHSWEFMQGNFANKSFPDTVYVTANPHSTRSSEDVFYLRKYLFESWNSRLGTVLPEDVAKAGIEAHTKYPNKRLIIHFMQPHEPHLGPTANQYRDELDIKGFGMPEADHQDGMLFNEAAERGLLSDEKIEQAYRETLNIAMKYVNKLIDDLNGKSVITADHGQMLGEQWAPLTSKTYGHPHDLYTKELCHVPWLEVPSEERRNVTKEKPLEANQVDQEKVEAQLKALGYK
jgi:hypothetical protein